MRVMKRIIIILLSLLPLLAVSQSHDVSFAKPLGIDLVLSANFGELRPDHFHSGVDFKTRGSIGYKVYAVEEGYVSRISVSPWGYGKALYIDHPSGYTSVYAHLDAMEGDIAEALKRMQYERQSYAIDTLLAPGLLPVTKGMYIAVSGNSGSSGGPHLHFEIRHTATESPIDPLPFYRQYIKDNTAPEPRTIALYHHDAVAHGDVLPKSVSQLQHNGGNNYVATTPFEAWGRVSLGIKAYDRMTGTTNIYGVRHVRCLVDDSLLYESVIDSITFAETRYINSLIDYHELRSNKGSTIMRTAILPGNKLSTLYGDAVTDGTMVIDQQRKYKGVYELTDLYGNRSVVKFVIQGKPAEPTTKEPDGVLFEYLHDNEYATEDMNIYLPAGALYDDFYFSHKAVNQSGYYSAVHRVHNRTVPLHQWGELAIKITVDTLPDEKYYMVYIDNDKKSPVEGRYHAGWITARVRKLGQYAIAADVTAPTITPVKPEEWGSSQKVEFKITDKESGIATYRGEIDGEFCLFEYDAKRNTITCHLDDTPFVKGISHELTLVVTDCCGNSSRAKHKIKW